MYAGYDPLLFPKPEPSPAVMRAIDVTGPLALPVASAGATGHLCSTARCYVGKPGSLLVRRLRRGAR